MEKIFTAIGIFWFLVSVVAMSYTLTVGVIENQVAAYTAFAALVILYLYLVYILRYKIIYRG